MTWGKGLDVSVSLTTSVWADRRFAEGWRVFVQDLWTGGFASNDDIHRVAEMNLANARLAGMTCAGYVNATPPDWWPQETAIHNAKLNAGSEWGHLDVIFVDVEIPGVTEARILELCQRLEAEGKRVAIYSARWFWDGHMGNPQWPWLLKYKIWNAYYDGDPDVDFLQAPWGPWAVTDVIGEQYGGSEIEGVTVDENSFNLDYFSAGAPAGKAAEMIVVQADGDPRVYVLASGKHIPDPAAYEALKAATVDSGGTWIHKVLPANHSVFRAKDNLLDQ